MGFFLSQLRYIIGAEKLAWDNSIFVGMSSAHFEDVYRGHALEAWLSGTSNFPRQVDFGWRWLT